MTTATTATVYTLMRSNVPLVVTTQPFALRDTMNATFKDWHARLLAGAEVWLMVDGERVAHERFMEWEGCGFAAELAPQRQELQAPPVGPSSPTGLYSYSELRQLADQEWSKMLAAAVERKRVADSEAAVYIASSTSLWPVVAQVTPNAVFVSLASCSREREDFGPRVGFVALRDGYTPREHRIEMVAPDRQMGYPCRNSGSGKTCCRCRSRVGAAGANRSV